MCQAIGEVLNQKFNLIEGEFSSFRGDVLDSSQQFYITNNVLNNQ